MRFLIDAQLPSALARWPGEQRHSATAVRNVGLRDFEDGSIWNFAAAASRVVVTKDEGFAARSIGGDSGPSVV